MKFCFVCGKKTENLIEGYCEDCYKKEFKLLEVPKEFSFTICPRCNFIKHRNDWQDIEIEELIKQEIKPLGDIVEMKIEKNDKIHISVKGFLKGSKKLKKEVHTIPLKLNKVLCPICIKRSTGYHEAILQLRGNITDDIIDFIDTQAINQNEFYRLEKVRNGFDLFIINKSFANKLAELTKRRFKANIKKSFKVVTRKEGKNIYRNIILVSIQW
jgi:nonsense-mediated mRNA decay protein 3